jgi:hypothetical protein
MGMKMSVGLAIGSMLGVAAWQVFADYPLAARVGVCAIALLMALHAARADRSVPVLGLASRRAPRLGRSRHTGNGMNAARHLSICIAWIAVATAPVSAQQPASAPDLSRYRQFQLGTTLAAVAAQVGPAPEVRVVHQRPVLIQEMVWYPPRSLGTLPDEEAVREVVFTFYDGALYRMLIEYDRHRTEGLTAGDIVDALAVQYGAATRPPVAIMASLSKGSHLSDEILANWDDPGFALTLFRPTYLSSFGLVMTERRLEGLARRATDEATRLDAQEAPQRDRDRQLAQGEETRAKQAKARQTNKGTFRP